MVRLLDALEQSVACWRRVRSYAWHGLLLAANLAVVLAVAGLARGTEPVAAEPLITVAAVTRQLMVWATPRREALLGLLAPGAIVRLLPEPAVQASPQPSRELGTANGALFVLAQSVTMSDVAGADWNGWVTQADLSPPFKAALSSADAHLLPLQRISTAATP